MSTPRTKYSPETISLASLDAPGTEREIPCMLMRRQVRRVDLPQVSATVPEHTLPRILIRTEDCSEMLLEYATKHNLLKPLKYMNREPMFPLQTRGGLHIMEKHNISPPSPCTLRVTGSSTLATRASPFYLFTPTTTSTSSSDEFVDALQKVLGEKDRPRWFIDHTDITWELG
ncbi:hypothetical protein B0H21DRAFT_759984, partial [Amylocystis lapponica]